jgi:predicted nucleotidyltransferase
MKNEIAQTIQRMVDILADTLEPKRIILFGSHARGSAAPDSDVDLLLIMANGTHRRTAAVKAYRVLGSQGISKDIVVVTEDDIKKYGSLPGTVLQPALTEGKVMYERAA